MVLFNNKCLCSNKNLGSFFVSRLILSFEPLLLDKIK